MDQAALRLWLLCQPRAGPEGNRPDRLARSRSRGGRARGGAPFSSASIHHGRDTDGRVHGIRGTVDGAFVIDAAPQIAERLMGWTMLDRDDELRAWLSAWKSDGGDAQRFRRALRERFGNDAFGAWRYSEQVLVPLRLKIRYVARALLVHPRHLPYAVVVGAC